MDPNSRLLVNRTRIVELHAEATSNRLAAQARTKSVVETPCREGGTAFRADLTYVGRLWIGRLLGQIGRVTPRA
jgi:hypothetical protein